MPYGDCDSVVLTNGIYETNGLQAINRADLFNLPIRRGEISVLHSSFFLAKSLEVKNQNIADVTAAEEVSRLAVYISQLF